MSDPKKSPRDIVMAEFADFADRRIAWYGDPKKVSLQHLLVKDVLMFAARGVLTADEFVEEAFHALESSSEETVMGNLWQRTIAAISTKTLDTGDFITEKPDALWVCEVKSQTNTTNSSSSVQELRTLKAKAEDLRQPRRGSSKPIKCAFCVIRGPRADETRTFHVNPRRPLIDADLEGFQYRYLVGSAFWEWLTDYKSAKELVENIGDLQVAKVRAAREACLARLKQEMSDALANKGLGATMDDVLKLV